MIRLPWRPEPTPDPVAPVPPPVPAGGLTQHQRDCLAVALHDRWHGDHAPIKGRTKADCAAAAGAYDDVAAIESLVVEWIRGD